MRTFFRFVTVTTLVTVMWRRLLWEDDGQDVIEYALLTAAIGLAGIAAWPQVEAAIGDVYQQLDGQTQDLWEVPDPGSN